MNEKIDETNQHTEIQFCRYTSNILYKKICDIESSINFLYDGKFFDSERKMKSIKASLIHLREECENRLKVISTIELADKNNPSSI